MEVEEDTLRGGGEVDGEVGEQGRGKGVHLKALLLILFIVFR